MNIDQAQHVRWMSIALEEARSAAAEGEIPVGCVIVHNDTIIAREHNRVEQRQDPTAHAELLAIQQAARVLRSRRLTDCTLYVTLEPCPMCAGAIVLARIPVVVFATPDPKAGAVASLYALLNDPRLNHRCTVVSGIAQDEAASLLKSFFQKIRQDKKSGSRKEGENLEPPG